MGPSPDRLFFFSGSADVYPGKGEQEHVNDRTQYTELAQIKNWRQILSNLHVAPFKYSDGHTYNTIEHVFQAQKIALVDPDKAKWFTVEQSRDDIGTGDGLMARRNRMLVLLPEPLIRKWSSMSDSVMAEAARCKYAACDVARQVLMATGDAELWHGVGKGQAVRFRYLEVLREQFRAEADCSH